METITQTNRTILFSEINPERLNLLTLIGDVRGKTSLDDDKIKEYKNYNADEILSLYKDAGWISYTEKPQMLKEAYEKSFCVLGAYEEDKLIGIIRAVGDGASILYIQDIRSCMNARKDEFPSNELDSISIATITGGLPREFERISIEEVLDGGLDRLGHFDNKHITFSFILNMGVYLTPAEMKEFDEKDKDGNTRSKLEVIKERLNIKPTVRLTVKPTGLNFSELRAMVNLKPKKYSDLTTDQLTVLRNKVLFRLEDEVQFHIEQWQERMRQIELVANERGITLDA